MRFCAIVIIIAGGCLLLSCGPKPVPAPSSVSRSLDTAPGPAPSGLLASPGDGVVNLRWVTHLADNATIKGFNIYMSREGNPFEKTTFGPYPGDLDSRNDVESYSSPALDNGVMYRFYVSTVYPGDIEAVGPDTVASIPRPEGVLTLMASFRGSTAGIAFAQMKSVPTDDLTNDIYLAVIKGRPCLASPSRIDDVLRKTEFFPIPPHRTFLAEYPREPAGTGSDLVAISAGNEVIVRTADHCYAFLTIDSVAPENESVKLSVIYQPRPRTFSF